MNLVYNHLARLVDGCDGGEHRRSGIREDNQGIDTLGRHRFDVGNGLLGIALAVGIFVLRDAGALEGFLLAGSGCHLSPAVAAVAIEQGNRRLLGAAP
jgi:hypothetical protein